MPSLQRCFGLPTDLTPYICHSVSSNGPCAVFHSGNVSSHRAGAKPTFGTYLHLEYTHPLTHPPVHPQTHPLIYPSMCCRMRRACWSGPCSQRCSSTSCPFRTPNRTCFDWSSLCPLSGRPSRRESALSTCVWSTSSPATSWSQPGGSPRSLSGLKSWTTTGSNPRPNLFSFFSDFTCGWSLEITYALGAERGAHGYLRGRRWHAEMKLELNWIREYLSLLDWMILVLVFVLGRVRLYSVRGSRPRRSVSSKQLDRLRSVFSDRWMS